MLLLLLLLLLRPIDGAKHSYVKASQHCCVHVCKRTSSSFVAFEAPRALGGWFADHPQQQQCSEPLQYFPWLA